jgi:Fic family protein
MSERNMFTEAQVSRDSIERRLCHQGMERPVAYILSLLYENTSGGLSVEEIVRQSGLSEQSCTAHLLDLLSYRLIVCRIARRQLIEFYSVAPDWQRKVGYYCAQKRRERAQRFGPHRD